MYALDHGLRTCIVLGLVVLALSGVVAGAHSGSLAADPMEAGASSTHTLTVTVEDRSTGQWTGLSVDYSESGANPGQITTAAVSSIGIDRDDDARGDDIDVDASDSLTDVSAESRGTLTFELDGSHSLETGDEIVVRYIGVYNPASVSDYRIPIDVNPSVGGGETDAKLQIGTNRATVLIDDQSTTGETVTVASARLPNGGFVVLHDEEALAAGTGNPAAITEASVVGTSSYLSAGAHQDVTVELTDEIDADRSYVAMAVKDGDGDESFDAEADGPYTVSGNPIWEPASFTIREPTATPSPTPTATPTAMEDTDTRAETPTETEAPASPTPADGPGFVATVALLALIGTVLALGRRRDP
jgi:PGF-CTERM protein